MERLLFQKNIDLQYPLQELISVSVKENLNYTLDQQGKRALGTLDIEGEYLWNKNKYHFDDVIEIDILAPFDRLVNYEDFSIEIEDYDYHIASGKLSLDIHVNAYGVLKKEDRHIVIEDEQERYEEIKEVMAKQLEEPIDVLEVQGEVENDFHIVSAVVDEELFDDDQNGFVVYSYYIAKTDDTYESVASTMGMDEDYLRKLNDYKEITPACLIRLKN